eukprot:9223085-Pyramimonas_sp.AAC.1
MRPLAFHLWLLAHLADRADHLCGSDAGLIAFASFSAFALSLGAPLYRRNARWLWRRRPRR